MYVKLAFFVEVKFLYAFFDLEKKNFSTLRNAIYMAAKRLPPPKYHLCGERRLAASECRQAPFPPILKIPSPSASPLSAGGHCGSLVDHMPPAAKSTLSRECHLYVMVAINMGEKVGNLPLEPLATIAGHAICRYAPRHLPHCECRQAPSFS